MRIHGDPSADPLPADGARLATLVLIAGASTTLLSRGLAESFAVFLLPLEQAFGTDRATLTGVYSLYMLMLGLAAPVVGLVIDRIGVRAGWLLGMAAFVVAFELAALASQPWHLYLPLGILCGIGTAALGMVPASVLASRWFDRRLPSALSVLYATLGTGILLFAPLAQWLIDTQGWRGAYRWLGLAPLVLALPLLLPGWRRLEAGAPEVMARRGRGSAAGTRAAVAQALRDGRFWTLFGVMFFTTMATYTVLIQLVAYLVESGFDPLTSASVYGACGIASTAGMLASGVLAERYGERRVATVSYLTSIAGVGLLAVLSVAPSVWLLAGFVLTFGAVAGSRAPLIAVFSSRLFPGSGQATIYGTVLIGMGIGGAIAAWASGVLHDLAQSYLPGFALSAAAALAGLVLFRRIERCARRSPAPG